MSIQNCNKTLNCLIKKNIKLICIDFDNTLLSISTYGKWDDTASKLATYVRGSFILFINNCIKKNINVAIVTFSNQHQLVKDVLQIIFKENSKKINVKSTLIRYSPKTRFCSKVLKNNKIKLQRKVPMMISVIYDIYKNNKVVIPVNSVLLIDDDASNINTARLNGFNTYHYINSSDISMFTQLQSMEGFNKSPTYTFVFADICKVTILFLLLIYAIWRDNTVQQFGYKYHTNPV